MASLSITKAWNETTSFFAREFQLVLPIAFLLTALPAAALQWAMPVMEPGPPNLARWLEDVRPFLLFIPVIAIVGMIGSIAITYLAIRPGASVGEALQVGLRRFFPLFLSGLLVALALAAVFVPLMLLAVPTPEGSGAGLFLLLILLYAVAGIALFVRLMLTTAIAAAERVGPVAIIARSWALTRGWFWKLLGFIILFGIAAVVALLVVSLLFGIVIALVSGPPVPGSGAAFAVMLLSAAFQAVVSTLYVIMAGRLYVQLSGKSEAEIFA